MSDARARRRRHRGRVPRDQTCVTCCLDRASVFAEPAPTLDRRRRNGGTCRASRQETGQNERLWRGAQLPAASLASQVPRRSETDHPRTPKFCNRPNHRGHSGYRPRWPQWLRSLMRKSLRSMTKILCYATKTAGSAGASLLRTSTASGRSARPSLEPWMAVVPCRHHHHLFLLGWRPWKKLIKE